LIKQIFLKYFPGYAPRLVKRLHKACLEYPGWKAKHSPELKYWVYPEQMANSPRIDLADVSFTFNLSFFIYLN